MKQRDWQLAIGATLLSAIAIAWPPLAPLAFLGTLVTFVAAEGAPRKAIGFVAAPLMMAAFMRFLLLYAVPNIVIAGEMAVEDKALNRLREVRWAEMQAKGKTSAFVPLKSLVEDKELGQGTGLLNEAFFKSDSQGVFRAESYRVEVLLRPEAPGSFVAFAWPTADAKGARRVFAIDQDDQICESSAARYAGDATPPATAAFDGRPGSPCGSGTEPGWHAWRNKKPLATAR